MDETMKTSLFLPVPTKEVLDGVVKRVQEDISNGSQEYLSEIADRIRAENPLIPEFLYLESGRKPLFSAGVYEILRLSLPDGQKLPIVRSSNRQLGRVLKYGNDSRMFAFYFGRLGNSFSKDFFEAMSNYCMYVGEKIDSLARGNGSSQEDLKLLMEDQIFPTTGRASGLVLILNTQGIEDAEFEDRKSKSKLKPLD